MTGYSKWPKAKKINWDEIDGSRRSSAPLPKWLYFGEISKAEKGLTGPNAKEPGAPKVSFVVDLKGSHGDLVDVGNRKAFAHLTFSEKAAWKMKQLCEALGCEPPETTGEDDLDEFASTILGETIWFTLRIRKNQNGEPDNEIDSFISEAESDEVAESMEPPGGTSSAKSKRNGTTNGRRDAAKAKEMDTDEDADDESDDDEDEAPPVEARRRGRPPKDRSARR